MEEISFGFYRPIIHQVPTDSVLTNIIKRIHKENKQKETDKMKDFKVGDRVRITANSEASSPYLKVGEEATIEGIVDKDKRYLLLDSGYYINPKASDTGSNCADWELITPPRFHAAQPGDLVYSKLQGPGFVIGDSEGPILPAKEDKIRIKWNNGYVMSVEQDGRHYQTDAEPTIFYRSETNNYLTERPETTYWTRVEVGTECEFSDDPSFPENDTYARDFWGYFPGKKNPFWCNLRGRDDMATGYKYARLIKENPA